MKLNRIPAMVNSIARTCKTLVLTALMLMIIISIIIYTIKVGFLLVHDIFTPPIGLLPQQLTELFADFLLALVGFGLLETVRAFFKDSTVHVEIVFQVAMIGVARKAILLDLNALHPVTLIGIGTIIIALSVGYFLVKKIFQAEEEQEPQS